MSKELSLELAHLVGILCAGLLTTTVNDVTNILREPQQPIKEGGLSKYFLVAQCNAVNLDAYF